MVILIGVARVVQGVGKQVHILEVRQDLSGICGVEQLIAEFNLQVGQDGCFKQKVTDFRGQ
jgi:hypothetical protein